MILIQLHEWENWRIAGEDKELQIQRLVDGKNGAEWRSTNYFATLDGAVAFAYERTLRESPLVTDSLDDVLKECERVKKALLKAVKKAVAEGSEG